MSFKRTILALGTAAMAIGAVQSAELAGLAPFTATSFGQQSDANALPAYTQSFVAQPGAMLESITWWGYHGANSLGPAFDSFVVLLDGLLQTGSIDIDDSNPNFSKYTLTVSPVTLSATTLSVLNDSPDVEWFWQSAASVGGAHATEVAYKLEGRAMTIPEPTALLLVLFGLFGAAAAGRYGRLFDARAIDV